MGDVRAWAPAGGQEQGIRSCLLKPRASGLSVHSILAVVDVWPLLHQDKAPSMSGGSNTSASEISDPFLSLFCKSPFLSTLSQDWAQSPTRGWAVNWPPDPLLSPLPPLAPCISQGCSFPSSGSSPESSPHPKSQVTSARLARSQQAIGEVWGVSGSISWFFFFWTTMGRVVRSCFCSLAALLWAEPHRVELPVVLLPVRGLSWGLQWMFSDICPIV